MSIETDYNSTKLAFEQTYPKLSKLIEEKSWDFENFYKVVKEQLKEAQRNFYTFDVWPCTLVYQFGFYYFSDGPDFGFFSYWQPGNVVVPFGYIPTLKEIILMDASVDICTVKSIFETQDSVLDNDIEYALSILAERDVYPIDKIESVFKKIEMELP